MTDGTSKLTSVASTTHVYVDESVHDKLGFVVAAFVVARDPVALHGAMEAALRAAGLEPGRDEYKSGAYMQGKPHLAALRNAVSLVLMEHAQIGACVAATAERRDLSRMVLDAVMGLDLGRPATRSLEVFIDENLDHGARSWRSLQLPSGVNVHDEQHSVDVLGVQAADLAAFEIALALRFHLSGGQTKDIQIWDEGLQEHVTERLGAAQPLMYRWNYFGETRLVYDEGVHDELPFKDAIGKGVLPSAALPDQVRHAVDTAFSAVYMGCMH